MARISFTVTLCAALLTLSLSPGFAQQMSTPQDRVLRPGDTIRWEPAGPHKLWLGAAGLTSLTEVDKILTFSPAPASEVDSVRKWNPAQRVTATVKDNAYAQGVKEFVFECGAHPKQMKSQPFTIESRPAGQDTRTLRIRSDPAIKWIMKKPDGTGEVQVSVAAP